MIVAAAIGAMAASVAMSTVRARMMVLLLEDLAGWPLSAGSNGRHSATRILTAVQFDCSRPVRLGLQRRD